MRCDFENLGESKATVKTIVGFDLGEEGGSFFLKNRSERPLLLSLEKKVFSSCSGSRLKVM
jgi:hypothetical protein